MLFFIQFHLLYVYSLLVVLLLVFEQRQILLFNLSELRIVVFKLLAFGSERHNLFLFFLEVLLLRLELFLVISLTVVKLAHLLLLLLHEFLVVVQLLLQVLDFFLLFLELSFHRIVLRLGHAHRLLY